MANALYDTGRNYFLNASINWVTTPVRMGFVSISNQPTAYVVSLVGDTVYASVPTGARVGFSVASLGTKTTSAGIADAADSLMTAVSGPTVGAVLLFASTATANAADWPLIAYIDTATGLPVGPNGGDITVQWDNGTNKVFKL